jgi:hypothetical protein
VAIATGAGARRDAVTAAILAGVLAVAGVTALVGPAFTQRPFVQVWTTVFVAVCVQALPFLVLGVIVGGLIAALLPEGVLPRILPRSPALSVPAAALAGAVLPGCECSSVPVAGRLMSRGAPAPAALAFLLAAPAINPVVLVATSVAFPGRPVMVLARFVASVIAAVAVGWIWVLLGAGDDVAARARNRHEHTHGDRTTRFFAAAQHDLAHAGGFLVVGAALAATLQTVVPRSILDGLAGHAVLAVAALAVLAVALALCSEADAFVAASLSQFPLTARLTFLVVGPMVDVKLVALQTGTFGRRFAMRFAPLTFVVAVTSAVVVGWWLL